MVVTLLNRLNLICQYDRKRAKKATHVLAIVNGIVRSIILLTGNIPKTLNTLDGLSFWALKTNIPHTLEKMSLLSMARVKIL